MGAPSGLIGEVGVYPSWASGEPLQFFLLPLVAPVEVVEVAIGNREDADAAGHEAHIIIPPCIV
ncbi:MAG TPA: hypothetical protein G4O12_06865 [Dehalococcoidia bacterium]|nr:hypothetical protein [Dehalococcoidia bacterium]